MLQMVLGRNWIEDGRTSLTDLVQNGFDVRDLEMLQDVAVNEETGGSCWPFMHSRRCLYNLVYQAALSSHLHSGQPSVCDQTPSFA